MEKKPTFVLVVAAAVRDPHGRVLLQQALPGKRHAGQWEFPGGKVETGENPQLALCREVAEELSIALDHRALEPAGFADEAGVGGHPDLVLLLYTCRRWSGRPTPNEGQDWGWFTLEEAALLPMAAMDRALLETLSG